jgi:hypothetical protein
VRDWASSALKAAAGSGTALDASRIGTASNTARNIAQTPRIEGLIS